MTSDQAAALLTAVAQLHSDLTEIWAAAVAAADMLGGLIAVVTFWSVVFLLRRRGGTK